MAVVYFSPIATDASASASYLDAVDGSTIGSLPSSGDTLIFYGGNSEITAGHAALAAVDFAEVIFLPTCRQVCKTPLQLMVSHSGGPGHLRYEGAGSDFRIMADGSGIDYAQLMPMSGQLRLSSDGAVNWTRTVVGRGTVYVEASAVTPELTNAGATVYMADGTAATTIYHNAGTTEDYRGAATVKVRGGTYRTKKDAAVSTKVFLSGGVFNPQSTGTIADIEATGGTLTPKGAPGPVTITDSTFIGTSENGPVVVSEDTGAKVTFTNDPTYIGTVAPIKRTGGDTGTGAGA